ncbi:MAG TPA: hypothetical protein VIJ51_00395 [Solirubrobacteraceae bacterium]
MLPQIRSAPPCEATSAPAIVELSMSTDAPDPIVTLPVIVAPVISVAPEFSVSAPTCLPVIVVVAVTV